MVESCECDDRTVLGLTMGDQTRRKFRRIFFFFLLGHKDGRIRPKGHSNRRRRTPLGPRNIFSTSSRLLDNTSFAHVSVPTNPTKRSIPPRIPVAQTVWLVNCSPIKSLPPILHHLQGLRPEFAPRLEDDFPWQPQQPQRRKIVATQLPEDCYIGPLHVQLEHIHADHAVFRKNF